MEQEKQLTAMQVLRDKLLERIKSDSCSEYEENILNEITHSINTELLTTERQQLIDFGDSCIRNVEYGFTTEKHFNNTFKTQQ